MEPIVVERPPSQELPNNPSQTWDKGMEISSVALLQQHLPQSKTHLSSGGFDCDNENEDRDQIAVFHYFHRGQGARGESCKSQHFKANFGKQLQQGTVTTSRSPPFVEQKANTTLRSSQVRDEADKGHLRTWSVSGRSFCRNFLRGRCFRGATCPDLHTECTTFIMPGYDWCAKLHQEILANLENPAGRASNPEIAGSAPTSSCGKSFVPVLDADASVFNKDSLSSINTNFNHEGSELQLAPKISSKKKRKRCSVSSSGSLDSAIAVFDKKTEGQCAKEATSNSKRKLLVLDVNGILVDIVACHGRPRTAFAMLSGKAVYKRPFCEEFLDFCFEQFDVGIWTSRKRKNIEKLVDLLLGEKKKKLLFCWDSSQCTDTGYKTLQNKDKPLVLKELKKLWEQHRPDVPWDKGYYNETNTVLLDDSPYKALRNPPHTAVFPLPYSFKTQKDNILGPSGDLRKYLMGLVEAENVQKFIAEHPFGQQPITESSGQWGFYRKVLAIKPCAPKKEKPKKQPAPRQQGRKTSNTSVSS